jgi:hypothetical protein
MEQWVVDPYVVAGVAITLFLAACVGALVAMRDSQSMPAKLVTRFLRCPERQRAAVVTWVERMRTGFAMRSVQSCSLLEVGERCDQGCCDLPPSEVRTEPNAAVTENPPVSA